MVAAVHAALDRVLPNVAAPTSLMYGRTSTVIHGHFCIGLPQLHFSLTLLKQREPRS